MNLYQFSKVCFIIVIVFLTQCLILLQAEDIVDSPIVKEVEQKKALYYNRKPPQGKNVVVVPKKLLPPVNVRKVVSPSPSPGTKRPININSTGGNQTQRVLPISKRGPSPLRVTEQPFQKENVIRKATTSSDGGKEQTASERTFFPPYKFPFWGMPYGIYSNGGFVNPGLFPFVPGGPGFPPYDGIFGSPFGPGLFPGKQNPIPPGVGTPMLPPGTNPSGQPPLNPTGNRRVLPRGAYSPGSPYGYRRPKPKPKRKPKPDPDPDPDDDSGCPCDKGKHEDTPLPRPHRRPRPTTTAPCLCNKPKRPRRPTPIEDYDDDDKHHVCPYGHEPEPTQAPTTTPPPPPPPTYPPTLPPTPPPTAFTNEPSSPKPKSKRCKLKQKTISFKPPHDYFSSSADDVPTLEIVPPQPETKKPCPLQAQKSVEYIYMMSPPYLPEPTTTTTTPSPPPPPPPPPIYTQATYQQMSQTSQQNPQPQQSNYQQNQQPVNYQQNSQPASHQQITPPSSPPTQQNPPPVVSYQQNYSQQATYQQNSPPQPDQQNTQPTSQQTTYQQNSSPPSNSIQQNIQPTTYQQNSQSATYVQQGTPTSNNQQQSVTNQLQIAPPNVVYTTNSQSASQSTAPTSQSMSGSHNTIIYKPAPDEIIHTPTSITVPLPLPPFMLNENGQLLQQPQQNPSQAGQQVTYKVDLNSDLLTKITTPVVIPENGQANAVPMSISQNSQLQALLRQLSSSNNQYNTNKPVTFATSGSRLAPMNSQVPQTKPQVYPQSRVFILDNLPADVSESSPMTYSSQSVIQPSSSLPSVVVLKSEPTYDFLQTNFQPQQQQISSVISYVQPQDYSASVTSPYLAPSVQATPDYNFLVNNGQSLNRRKSHRYKTPATSNIPYPYRYAPAYDYQEEVPYRRSPSHDKSNYNTKDYVVIDREELDELKRTLISDSSYEEDDKNLPPPPDVVHIEYHPRMEDNREDFNKPLSFNGGDSNLNNHNSYYYERSAPSLNNQKYYDYSQYEREMEQNFNPQQSIASLFDSSKDTVTAEGSTQFSRVFNMNNEDIRGVGPRKKKKKRARGTLMVFDKYLQNSDDDEIEK